MSESPPDRIVRCIDLHGGEREFPAAQLRFRPACYGIAIEKGRVLLGRSVFHRRWELPGGGISPWETLEEGLIREFAEETGLRPEVEGFVGLDEGFVAFFQHPFHSLRFFYRVRLPAGSELRPQAGEVDALEWWEPAELEEKDLAVGHGRFIRAALELGPK